MPVEYHRGAFPPTALNWNALIPLIGPTSAAIARYDGVLAAIPDPSILWRVFAAATRRPGEYRRIPVWIGPDRHNATTARYLPINAADLPAAMGEWEK